MKKTLFQYCVLHHELVNDKYETKILLEPNYYLANSKEDVKLFVGSQLPKEYLEKLDQVEVIIRPF